MVGYLILLLKCCGEIFSPGSHWYCCLKKLTIQPSHVTIHVLLGPAVTGPINVVIQFTNLNMFLQVFYQVCFPLILLLLSPMCIFPAARNSVIGMGWLCQMIVD
jgi:hypothetical protein